MRKEREFLEGCSVSGSALGALEPALQICVSGVLLNSHVGSNAKKCISAVGAASIFCAPASSPTCGQSPDPQKARTSYLPPFLPLSGQNMVMTPSSLMPEVEPEWFFAQTGRRPERYRDSATTRLVVVGGREQEAPPRGASGMWSFGCMRWNIDRSLLLCGAWAVPSFSLGAQWLNGQLLDFDTRKLCVFKIAPKTVLIRRASSVQVRNGTRAIGNPKFHPPTSPN